MPSTQVLDNFIEFPQLNKLPLNWRDQSDDSSSDCIITVHGGDVTKSYSVHLQEVSRSSTFFYKIATKSKQLAKHSRKNVEISQDSSDVTIKLSDGVCLALGCLSDCIRDLKEKVFKSLHIPVIEQILLRRHESGQNLELSQDWRSLAAYNVKKGEILFLNQKRTWQHFDSLQMNSLSFHLPELCIRCVRILFWFLLSCF
jgi:hypothetical protein